MWWLHFSFLIGLFLFFEMGVLLCSPCWAQAHSPVWDSQVLELTVCTTMTGIFFFFFFLRNLNATFQNGCTFAFSGPHSGGLVPNQCPRLLGLDLYLIFASPPNPPCSLLPITWSLREQSLVALLFSWSMEPDFVHLIRVITAFRKHWTPPQSQGLKVWLT
jgi:hypothetical protein